jgi:hypothetical protein
LLLFYKTKPFWVPAYWRSQSMERRSTYFAYQE